MRILFAVVVAAAVLAPVPPARAQAPSPAKAFAVYDMLGDEIALGSPQAVGLDPVYINWKRYANPVVEPARDAATQQTSAVAAYGESATTCTVTLEKAARSFRGATSCSRAVAQTAEASTSGGAAATGSPCSGTRTTCTSSGTTTGAFTTLRYRITLIAPRGQGWVAPPSECSGAGTDQLDCTFVL